MVEVQFGVGLVVVVELGGCRFQIKLYFLAGKYHPGVDKPDPRTWKANFRCAMNSVPYIEQVKDSHFYRKGSSFKVYRLLTEPERPVKKGGNQF